MDSNADQIAAEQAFYEKMAAEPTPEPAVAEPDPNAANGSAAEAREQTEQAETPVAETEPAEDTAEAPADAAEDASADEPEDAPDAPETPDPDPLTGPFAEAMRRAGVDLDALKAETPAAQAAVLKQFKNLEAGYTRVRQRETAELTEARAELRFQREHPADYVVSLLREHPEYDEIINAKLAALSGNTTMADDHETAIAHRRATARVDEAAAMETEQTLTAKVDALETRLQDALTAGKVTAGPALTRLLRNAADLAEAQTGSRMLTETQVDEIAADYIATVAPAIEAAREHGRRLERRNTRNTRTTAIVQTRQAAPPITPGSGTVPGVGKRPMPKNDDEFARQFAGQA